MEQKKPERQLQEQNHMEKELPPFVKTWKQFYRLLIGWLIFLILIFYAFTKYFE